MTFTGTATDDAPIKSIDIAMLNNSTGENLTVDGTWGFDNGLNVYGWPSVNQQSYNWTWTTPHEPDARATTRSRCSRPTTRASPRRRRAGRS